MTKCSKKEKTFNTKLFVRILPTTDVSYDSIKIECNRQVLYVRCLQDFTKGVNLKPPNYWSFCTDGVFWNSSQAEVYDTIAGDWYDDIFDGISGMILSYGQTGSGKTFTTSGLRFQYQNRGLILRTLSQLFEEKERRRDIMKITFGMSYLEFLGENVRDLITGRPIQKIKEVPEHLVPNDEWAWRQIFNAECKKSFYGEAPYPGSNRGHTIWTFYIHAESLVDTDPVVTHSKIHIIDMAGIGNYGSTSSPWKNKFDVGQSNLSKSLMEQLIICVRGGTWKEEDHICPYKSSRLLMYLHDTLQPTCFIRFVAHIFGNDSSLPLTVSTLKFGQKLRGFKPTKLERIVESSSILRMRNLERECIRLKEEAELAEMLRDSPEYSSISQERLLQIRRAAEGFLCGQLENLTLFSFGQAAITLEVFRDLYHRLSEEKDQMIKDAVATATEMLQNQYASEKNISLASPGVPSTQRMSRRRSRQETQLGFGVSHRSSDSNQQNSGKPSTVVQQAGVTDRRGISIGPGKVSSLVEGNITKAVKKLRTRKSDSLILKTGRSYSTKDTSICLPKSQCFDEAAEYSLPQCIPSRENAWQSFCMDNADLVQGMRSNIEYHEETAKAARKKYTQALSELSDLRDDIEKSRREFQNCQHIRQIIKTDERYDDTNPVPDQMEKEIQEALSLKEEQLNDCIEKCHVALIDFKTLLDELNTGKKALEDTFQDYCKIHYKIVFLPEETSSVDCKSETRTEDMPCDFDARHLLKMNLYLELQNKLLNYVSV
ncbi:hypothetical protein RUM43_005368 [Polyplax serrata]|uniref:Kinesin motor domain-containing protein n=1 Tax=Polyplax serrata TaxID=468196 RepID=A0AAN8S4Q4_POLSC